MALSEDQKRKIQESLNSKYGADAVNNLTNQISSGNMEQANQSANQMKQATQQTVTQTPQNTTQNTSSNQVQNQNQSNTNSQTINTPTQQNQTQNQTQNQVQNQTKQFDPNEQFDSSMIGENKGVSVKEGTAQQTGMPDYMATSDARMQEITNNLNSYYATNPEYFNDRATFNSIFHYDERDQAQQTLLDTYWKKKELGKSTGIYTTGDSITQGFNNADITEDQLNYIKEYNQDAYRQWQENQQKMVDRMIANETVPTVDEIVGKLTEYIDKLDLGSKRYDFMQYNEELKAQYQVDSKLQALEGTIAKMQSDKASIDSVIKQYSNTSSWGLGGAAANNARMLKALAPYQESFAMNAQIYSSQLQSYQMSAAQVKSDLNVMYQQTQEDQRVWQNKLDALGFAMKVDSYRTPEQEMANRLKENYYNNELSILNQSKMNDLSLYNQYATAKMQSQLAFELTDLNVNDPQQQKINLNNALNSYYEEYGSIIQRSQSQALQDILDYAKKNNCSVAEALTENFIKPLQNKKEYKSLVNANYKMSSAVASTNSDGSIRYDYVDTDVIGGMEDFLSKYKEGDKGGQCGAFVNDYLQSLGLGRVFVNDVKDKLAVSDPYDADSLGVGDVVVFDYSSAPRTKLMSDNSRKYGHVAIVTDIDRTNGTMTITESNYAGTERVHTRTIPLDNQYLAGMYSPSSKLGSSGGTSGLDRLDKNTKAEAEAIIKQIQTGAMTPSETSNAREKFKERGILDEFNKALDKGLDASLTSAQQSRYDKAVSNLSNSPVVKNFEESYEQLGSLITALQDQSGAGDMSAIFTFMKTLDPSSVVREGEFQQAAKAGGLTNSSALWQNLVQHNWDGTYLTPQLREDFKKVAIGLVKNKAKLYELKYGDFKKELNAAGISNAWADTKTNLAQVFLDEIESAYPTKNDVNVISNTYFQKYTANKSYSATSSDAEEIFNS